MHSDIHLVLHTLRATELHEAATDAAPKTPAAHATAPTPVRVRLGWKLVEFGLKLAVPHPRAACAHA